VYIAHGQVVVDGFITMESEVVILPWGDDRSSPRRPSRPDDRASG
jgi:hypothetical protein